MKIYVYVTAVLALLATGFWFKSVLEENKDLRATKAAQVRQIETYQANTALLNAQLAKERQIRENAEKALSELKDVPDDDFNQKLPDSVQGVIDRFHDSIGVR